MFLSVPWDIWLVPPQLLSYWLVPTSSVVFTLNTTLQWKCCVSNSSSVGQLWQSSTWRQLFPQRFCWRCLCHAAATRLIVTHWVLLGWAVFTQASLKSAQPNSGHECGSFGPVWTQHSHQNSHTKNFLRCGPRRATNKPHKIILDSITQKCTVGIPYLLIWWGGPRSGG